MIVRRFSFLDTEVWELVQQITDDTCEGSSVLLSETDNIITLDLTESMWIKLYSSIMTGSDLVYPSEAHEIRWAWLKGVECAMTFCERMIDCFQNDEDTREALIQAMITELLADPVQAEAFRSAMQQLGIGTTGANTQTGTVNPELTGMELGDCTDLDVLYGKCYVAVGGLNDIVQEILDWVQIYTNDEELAGMLADNVPAVAAIAGSALEIALWIRDSIIEEYLADWDTTRHEYWACKIYCLAIENGCVLTFETMREAYYNELLVLTPPPLTSGLEAMLAWYVDQVTLSAEEYVGIIQWFALEILMRTGDVFGANWRTLEIPIMGASPIEPLCDCCEPLLFPFDTDTEVDLIAGNAYNTVITSWQSNTWVGSLPCLLVGSTHYGSPASPSRISFFQVNLDPDCTYNNFSIEMYSEGFSASNLVIQFWTALPVPLDGSGYFASAIDAVPNPNGYRTISGTFSGGFTPTAGYVIVGVGSGGLASNGLIRVKNLTLT